MRKHSQELRPKHGAALLISCEHAGNRIPAAYRKHFVGKTRLLDSHRAYDRGAGELAKQLARSLQAPLVTNTISRLLIDLNRSPNNPQMFSYSERFLSHEEQRKMIERFYDAYLEKIEAQIECLSKRAPSVVHLGVHSFCPVLKGVRRNAEFGILYDPKRSRERAFAEMLQRELCARSELRIRRNYPYLGTSDGLTTTLRKRWPQQVYLGIEFELNQSVLRWSAARQCAFRHALVEAITEVS